jgi:hypothetical protein
MGVMFIIIAAMTTLLPVSSRGYVGGDKQYVATVCNPAGYPCNNCSSGTKDCTDHTCSQCAPQQ